MRVPADEHLRKENSSRRNDNKKRNKNSIVVARVHFHILDWLREWVSKWVRERNVESHRARNSSIILSRKFFLSFFCLLGFDVFCLWLIELLACLLAAHMKAKLLFIDKVQTENIRRRRWNHVWRWWMNREMDMKWYTQSLARFFFSPLRTQQRREFPLILCHFFFHLVSRYEMLRRRRIPLHGVEVIRQEEERRLNSNCHHRQKTPTWSEWMSEKRSWKLAEWSLASATLHTWS